MSQHSAAALALLLLLLATGAVGGRYRPVPALVKVGKLTLSSVGCGTWSWGNRFLWGYDRQQDAALQRTFDKAVALGINWFDTGDTYGTGSLEGQSERLLGEFSSGSSAASKRRKVYFATKIAPFFWRSSLAQPVSRSSERLQRDIDILQLHWPPTFQLNERQYLRDFSDCVASGRATQLGVSNYGAKGLARISHILESQGGARVASNQVQLSLLSRYPLENGLADTCEESDIQLIGYSPLALGLLADYYTLDKLPSGPRAILFREYLPSMQELLGELRSVAAFRGKTVAQVAINWCLCKGAMSLVGARSERQAEENAGARGWRLSAPEVLALDVAAARSRKQLIQNANQAD